MPFQVVERLVYKGPVDGSETIILDVRNGEDDYKVWCHAIQPSPPGYTIVAEYPTLPPRVRRLLPRSVALSGHLVVGRPIEIGQPLIVYVNGEPFALPGVLRGVVSPA